MDSAVNTDFKRKVPAGMRPVQGSVPSTVFHQASTRNNSNPSGIKTEADLYLEQHRHQKQEQTQIRNEEKRRDMEMLNNYNPWGKPGGGAPRVEGVQMNMLDKNLHASDVKAGSFVDNLSKPGCGAPYRTESGNPIGTVHVHPDIRNNLDYMNEETKKKSVLYGGGSNHHNPVPKKGKDGTPSYTKPQILETRQKTDGDIRENLKARLDKQIEEKRASLKNERDLSDIGGTSDWMSGKVGYVQRDTSGKIIRSDPLGERGPDGLREYYSDSPNKGLVQQLGRPGPGVPARTHSGKTCAQVRGVPTAYDDPFRPGRNKSPANKVFPVDIEHAANERAHKRKSEPILNTDKHMIQNGYYPQQLAGNNATFEEDPRFHPQQPIGTVYSAVIRSHDNYLDDLRRQIAQNNSDKVREKKKSHEQDFFHIKHSDIFGRPGNGAPRLIQGQLQTSRNKLDELATHSEGFSNPGAFRGLH